MKREFKILIAEFSGEDPDTVQAYETEFNRLIERGFLPWGAPGVGSTARGVCVVQHMVKEKEDDDDDDDDMG